MNDYALVHADRKNLIVHLVAAQGLGHKGEKYPPLPFAGPVDAMKRILVEQYFRFPLFVWSGRWHKAWSDAGPEG